MLKFINVTLKICIFAHLFPYWRATIGLVPSWVYKVMSFTDRLIKSMLEEIVNKNVGSGK